MRRILTIAFFISTTSGTADTVAQDVRPQPADVRRLYEKLEFDAALTTADDVLKQAEAYSPEDIAGVHTIAALIRMSRNEQEAARIHFESALSADPTLSLDPLLASPKVIAFFNAIKERAAPASDEAAPTTRYLRVYDRRPSAAMRSMLLPGWGQMYKGHRTRGTVMMTVWGLTAAGTITAHFVRANREDRYLSETDPLRVADRFSDFDRWHKVRNNLALAAVATWIVSYVDALLFESPADHSHTRTRPRLRFGVDTSYLDPAPKVSLTVPLQGPAHGLHTP